MLAPHVPGPCCPVPALWPSTRLHAVPPHPSLLLCCPLIERYHTMCTCSCRPALRMRFGCGMNDSHDRRPARHRHSHGQRRRPGDAAAADRCVLVCWLGGGWPLALPLACAQSCCWCHRWLGGITCLEDTAPSPHHNVHPPVLLLLLLLLVLHGRRDHSARGVGSTRWRGPRLYPGQCGQLGRAVMVVVTLQPAAVPECVPLVLQVPESEWGLPGRPGCYGAPIVYSTMQ